MKKNTNNIIKKSLFIFFLVLAITTTATIYAQDKGYTVLAPLPKIGDSGDGTTNLNNYLPAAFNLAVGIAAGMAFVVIVFGGITYAVSDSLTGKEEGKKWATNAVYGLLLVIGAYVILYTINPQILDFKLTIPRPYNQDIATIEPGGKALPGYKLTAEEVAKNQEMMNDLSKKYYVSINAGPCTNGETKGCTNLVGLPGSAYSGVVDIKRNCGCNITITGGTEGGHTAHGPGKPVLDIKQNPELDAFVKKNAFGTVVTTDHGPVYSVRINNKVVQFLDEGANEPGSTDAHWHVRF